jgi:Mg-chelatase subunit ChlD
VREIFYRLRQPALSRWPGAHRSRSGETGFEFRAHQPLAMGGDARRIDVHASLRDPFGDWQVRLYAERVSVTVVVVADLSASMAFVGRHSKMATLAALTRALAWSAARAGDAFGFVGCAARVDPTWWLAPSRSRGAGLALADRLDSHLPQGPAAAHAGALAEAAAHLPRRRSLVFLVSDFHLPLPLIERTLDGLAGHEVVPVILRDEAEHAAPAVTRSGHALVSLRDAESGAQRLLWWRPALAAQQAERRDQARAGLAALLRRHQLGSVLLDDGFSADRVTAFFHR